MIILRDSAHLALVLRHLREERALTRRDLARLLFLSGTTVGNRELGTVGVGTGDLIEHARPLGYDVALVPRAGALTPDRRTA